MPSLGFETYALILVLAAVGACVLTAFLPLDRLARPQEARRGRRRSGGVAIFVAFVLAFSLASLISSDLSDLIESNRREIAGLLGAALMILLLGVLDDVIEVDFKLKFLVQAAAAGLVFAVGYRIEDLSMPWGASFSVGAAAPLLTILWLVFLTNAMNLIDGKDGIAAGVAIIVALPLALIAGDVDKPLTAALLVAVAGGSLGFLPFNLPVASRLLGDSGALLLGFLLGALAIEGSTGVTGSVFISVPVMALGFPILDTILSFVRRGVDLRHPFLPDRDHIQHRLEGAGLTDRGVVLYVYVLCVVFSAAAMVLHFVEAVAAEFLAFFAFTGAIALIIYRLDYAASLWNSVGILSVRDSVASALGLRRSPPTEARENHTRYEERRVPANRRRPF